MNTIRMVDLHGQYQKIKEEVDKSIISVIESTEFIKGHVVEEFEKELAGYLNVGNVISCANGTDALQVAMMALGLKPGDEVITSDFTFVATVEVIALLGLVPVLVDVDPVTFNIDPEKIRKAITPRTRAIVPVHLFGQCSDMDKVMQIAKEFNLFVIEDNAQAIGASYLSSTGAKKKAGTIGDIGCTSFFPSKNLGCYGDGGALFTNDDEIAAKLKSVVNHGMTRRYYHDHIGVNSRLDTIQAAVLRIKLKNLEDYNSSRRKAAEIYNKAFDQNPFLTTPKTADFTDHVFHQYTLIVSERRDELHKCLTDNSIPSAIYYPVPLHRQKAYMHYPSNDSDFPVTNMLSEKVLSLPMHTELTEDQQIFIAKKINEFFK